MARSTISPSREGIGRGECQSKHSKQANVGFRPSMTYTSIGEASKGQYDLIFLFDASSSQDNQVSEMIESAKNIILKFAGDDKN